MSDDFDVIVVGAGPGGATTASYLSDHGLDTLMVDKETFPRDKACGDAISGKSISVLNDLGVTDWVEKEPHSRALGVIFSNPRGDVVEIPFPKKKVETGELASDGEKEYDYLTPGYVSRREVFDNILFEHASQQEHVTTREGFQVTDLVWDSGRVRGITGIDEDGEEQTYKARIVVGADGPLSIVARTVGAYDRDPDHWVAAIRVYFEDIEDLTENIELHFLDEVLPGYFWIFPLEDNLANVGVGVLESKIKEHKARGDAFKLKNRLYDAIENNPLFEDRFENAKEVPGSRNGWQLPLGSKPRKMYGNGWVLVGDAASLIDPFSGEGIGNAMVSGKLAARRIKEAFEADDISEEFLKTYEDRVLGELGRELELSHKLQQLGQKRWLLNFVIGRASKKEKVQELISDMLADRDKKEEFGSIWFYLKLLVL